MAEARLRRVAHPVRIVGFVVLVMALVAGAFVVGRSVKDPQDEALQAAQQNIEVYSRAEERVVDAGHSWQGDVRAGDQADVTLSTAPDGRAVITRQVLKKDEELKVGDLVAVVSGRPRILVAAKIPLYRDLRPDDRGDDVAALQRFLTDVGLYDYSIDGRFDWNTEHALSQLFDRHGFALPTETTTTNPPPSGDDPSAPPSPVKKTTTVVRWEEFVQVRHDGGTVVSVTPTATVLTDDLVLCRLRVSNPSAAFVLPVDADGAVKEGQKVTVAGADGEVTTTVRSVGAFQTAGEKQDINGFPVVVDLPADAKFRPGSPVRISVPGSEGKPQLAVPTVAIKQGSQGAYVSVRTDSGRVDVAVTVLAQQGGWTAVEPADPELLTAGAEVLVS